MGEPFHPETVREWVERTCAAQGIKVKVTDPDVLRQVAVLLTAREVKGATAVPHGPDQRPPDRARRVKRPHGRGRRR